MKKLKSSLSNMLLVLTGVTVIAVGLLAYVNELTKEPIALANLNTLNTELRKVVPDFTNNPVTESDTIYEEANGTRNVKFIIYPAKNGEKLVGTAIESSAKGYGGDIKVLVGLDTEGKIYDYSLLSHSETPGLGSKADIWFKKDQKGSIIGLNPGENPIKVKNDGGQIDAITASTITSRAFLNAVNAAYTAYIGGTTDASTSATGQTETPQSDSTTSATGQVESPQSDGTTSATINVESTDTISVNK